jgi:uncharacterized repeat protein (TIGR01451 family)
MTSILSAITGQFIQSLVLSTFIPVTVFLAFFQIFVAPFFVTEATILRPLEALDPQWQVLAFFIAAILLTGLLYNLNIPIIRLYEGYSWQDSWIGKWRICHYKSQLKAAEVRCSGMRTLLRRLDPTDGRYADINNEWTRLGRRLNAELPGYKEDLILPTQLGNVIRCFEYYPDRRYDMDAVTLWSLLVAKIDKDYAIQIDGAKASFDFMINSSFLSFILAALVVYAGWRYPTQIEWFWLVELILFLAFSYLFYTGSIGRASAWGRLVKGAFDLYRRDLLKQLGYNFLPMGEHELWDKISRQMIYGSINLDKPAVQEQPPRFARGESIKIDLEMSRGFSHRRNNDFTVTIQVKNIDNRKREAKKVIITDTVPDGFEYVWDSAHVNSQSISVAGTNPYHFELNNIPYLGSQILTYNIIALKP